MYCYVVKRPVFHLQRGSAKSPLAPSVLDLYAKANQSVQNRSALCTALVWQGSCFNVNDFDTRTIASV